jgi:hypothetical protein
MISSNPTGQSIQTNRMGKEVQHCVGTVVVVEARTRDKTSLAIYKSMANYTPTNHFYPRHQYRYIVP